jgi:predicted methyltransferase
VRAGKDEVIAEIEAAGFALHDQPQVQGLSENYMLRFRRP